LNSAEESYNYSQMCPCWYVGVHCGYVCVRERESQYNNFMIKRTKKGMIMHMFRKEVKQKLDQHHTLVHVNEYTYVFYCKHNSPLNQEAINVLEQLATIKLQLKCWLLPKHHMFHFDTIHCGFHTLNFDITIVCANCMGSPFGYIDTKYVAQYIQFIQFWQYLRTY